MDVQSLFYSSIKYSPYLRDGGDSSPAVRSGEEAAVGLSPSDITLEMSDPSSPRTQSGMPCKTRENASKQYEQTEVY